MKDSRICHPKTRPLSHKDYFELKAIEEKKKVQAKLPTLFNLPESKISIYNKGYKLYNVYIYIYIPRIYIQKETATHSSILAWRIPGTGEPGRLSSMGSHRVGHD